MIDFLLKHKVFKNEKHAHIVIIGFIVLCAAISISLFTYATKAPKIKYNLSPSVINNLPPNVQKTIYESYK